jgi:hypothetical protein
MRRLVVIAATLLTLSGVSAGTATANSASVCQPDGTGCTKAGTYPGPNAVINSNFLGVKVVWTKSVVQPYSSGVPLYWTAYMTYTNITSAGITLGCPGGWADASYVSEHMSGGSGDDGTVSAENTSCSQDPGLVVPVAPGGTYTLSATFHNVPWPGSTVAITWGNAGTSPNVSPFRSSSPPPPGASCQNWYMLGLHGINEGPEPKGGAKEAPELTAFKGDLKHDGPIYGHAQYVDVPYPTIAVSFQHPVATVKNLVKNVQAGVNALQAKVKHYTSTCSGSLISLFGFSEGAWIINVWEQQHPGEASTQIRNVGLIGDPCFWNIAGDAGLARLFTGSCGADADYLDTPAPMYSSCVAGDPVCGRSYFGVSAAQVAATAACFYKYKACAHSMYVKDGDVATIAGWMLTET